MRSSNAAHTSVSAAGKEAETIHGSDEVLEERWRSRARGVIKGAMEPRPPTARPAVIVHGGAGEVAPGRIAAVQAGCLRAVDAGLAVLAAGGGALDAAQAAVRVLEEEPEFNAGTGAVLTRAGTVEMDAALMDGRTLRIGAVAAMRDAPHAIDIARAVLEDGEHVLLCGEGA